MDLPLRVPPLRQQVSSAFSLPGIELIPVIINRQLCSAWPATHDWHKRKTMNTNLKKDQKNGIAKITAMPNVQAPTAKPQNEKPSESVKPSLDERIQKIEELRSLTGKRQNTLSTLHNLRGFTFASDENCKLVLMDSQNNRFETNNTNLITMLTSYFIAVLGDKVSALDDEILNFKL